MHFQAHIYMQNPSGGLFHAEKLISLNFNSIYNSAINFKPR